MGAKVLLGQDAKQVRCLLQSLLKAGRLQARRTYYDYYDSCHAPVETPDAQWTKAIDVLPCDCLKRDAIRYEGDGVFTLFTGYSTYQVKRQE